MYPLTFYPHMNHAIYVPVVYRKKTIRLPISLATSTFWGTSTRGCTEKIDPLGS